MCVDMIYGGFYSVVDKDLSGKDFSGTIPSQISTFTKLTSLYALHLNQFIECWSYSLRSVGHICSSLSLFFCHSYLDKNALSGMIPSQISTLTKLSRLYAQIYTALLSVGHIFY